MAWKKTPDALFTGGSGQMAVIGELLHRKCNAAIPHIDVGMDVFAFLDDREEVARIQVKTAQGKWYANREGYSARFGIPLNSWDEPPPRHFFTPWLCGSMSVGGALSSSAGPRFDD